MNWPGTSNLFSAAKPCPSPLHVGTNPGAGPTTPPTTFAGTKTLYPPSHTLAQLLKHAGLPHHPSTAAEDTSFLFLCSPSSQNSQPRPAYVGVRLTSSLEEWKNAVSKTAGNTSLRRSVASRLLVSHPRSSGFPVLTSVRLRGIFG